MTEELIAKKENANSLMNSGEYDKAIEEYSNIINSFKPSNEDEIIIYSLCLLNRSICYIHLENLDKGFDDAKMVIETAKIIRPNLDFTPEDKLSGILALAELRIGQIHESRQDTLPALLAYTRSIKYNPKAGAQDCLFRIYGDLELPMLDIQDQDLKLFADLIMNLPEEAGMVKSLTEILQYFDEDQIPESVLDKFADEGVYMIIFVAMQLWIHDAVIVLSLLTIARHLAQKGILDVFDGCPVVRTAMEHFKDNADVIGAALRFLQLAVTSSIDDDDFVGPLLGALDLDITRDEADIAFMILFNLVPASNAEILKEHKIIEKIFKWKTNSAILLLSKATCNCDLCIEAYEKGAAAIAKNVLTNIDDEFLTAASLQILSKIALQNFENFTKDTPEYVDLVTKVVTKNSKNVTVASHGFSCLSIFLPKAVEKVKECRTVRAASLIFLVNQKEEEVVRAVISFLFVAAQNGLVDSITEISTLVPSILNALPMYITNQEMVERAIAIAAVTGHPKTPALIGFGLEKFPNSMILKSLVASDVAE